MFVKHWHLFSSDDNTFYPFGLFQLLVELVKHLIVFLSHVSHLLLVELGIFFQSPLQLGNLCLTLGPGETE